MDLTREVRLILIICIPLILQAQAQNECNLIGLCQGELLYTADTDSHTDCQRICANTTGCQFYTYDPALLNCYLFSDCPSQDDQICPRCVSGRPSCKTVSYLLTVGSFDFEIDVDGSANAFPGDEVLLLSLDSEYPLPDCLAELPSFPETIFGSASGLIYPGEVPLVCGGVIGATDIDAFDNITNKCYEFDPVLKTWQMSGKMSAYRYYMGYAESPSWGLVVAGGWNEDAQPQNSVEQSLDGANFNDLPQLPLNVYGHCLAIVDDNTLFFTGGTTEDGFDNGTSTQTYVFTKNKGIWERVQDMPTGRKYHSCGVVRKQDTSEIEIVVAGGFTPPFHLSTVEIYNIANNQWRTAANELPNPLSRTPTVQTGDTFLLVGGFMGLAGATSDILSYNQVTENFDLYQESLPYPLYYHAAMLVDATLFEPCESKENKISTYNY